MNDRGGQSNQKYRGIKCVTSEYPSHGIPPLARPASDESCNARRYVTTLIYPTKKLKCELHGLYWYHPTGGPAEGATVLARVAREGHAIEEGDVLCAVKSHAKGRVLWMGSDDTWLWRQHVGDQHFYQFWQNALRFVTKDAGVRDD
jgi:hypothetical protein